VNDELKLLVEWSSPWQEFRSAVQPALMRSPQPLAGEARTGLFPYQGMVVSWIGEVLFLALVMLGYRGLDSMHPYQAPPPPKYDVIYYSGDELPQTEDVGGAQSGRSGRSGGREGYHPTQVIRVARGAPLREKVVDAPKLNLPRSDAAVANLLAFKPVPGPPPAEGLKSSVRAPALAEMAAVAPAPQVEEKQLGSQPTMMASVVPPAPTVQDIAPVRLPGSHDVEVIPPPVSAPEQTSNLNPRLTLPAPRAIAPPPSQVAHEISAMGPGFGSGELHKQVIPPPAQLGDATGQQRTAAGLGSATVVPPPVQVGAASGVHQPAGGLGGGTAVVPPPPTVSGGTSLTGRGRGSRGGGMGGPGEMGDLAAPPSGGGAGRGAGVVVSDQPGSKVGVPGGAGLGSIAMSPSGGANPGLGGSGGGAGIGHGNGPGSGFSGTGPGAGREGSGRGSDPNARGGISPTAGPGGAGTGADGTPAMPGVSVRGGNIITLPSFGSGGVNQSSVPGRSSVGDDPRHGITVVATPRSGGAFNFYGVLKGDKVYTIYIDTVLGTAVMEFADPTSAEHPSVQELVAPQPIRADLPSGMRRSRLVIACVLDRSGLFRNAQVIESAGREMTAKVLTALTTWKFRPALRGDQPIEVNALLGFDIDTSDRY
jgi:hypothetical protein